ncbi:TonB family protein [Mesorhizobium sp. RP14(2022)]|uniref:TonB family protein n=1 Tax=Mesorhizobium liriopis TaxID=2953882 RepID=A0ABT1C6J1_9HYPH|nr:TonB family protein [Mesorhizobium liriopis]MCO6050449.1 TonB family protein [Mesorhizobium liriopis]
MPQLPSLREAGLWGGAAAFVLAAHLGAAYYLRDIEPAPVENAALEQSMEIELAPLVIDTPESVQSETLAEAPPVEEVLQPEELTPSVEETVPEEVTEAPPETVTAETPAPVTPEEVVPEPVETAEAPPVEEITPETPVEEVAPEAPEPVIEEQIFAATPEVEVPLPLARPEIVRPERQVAQERPRQRPRPRQERPVERREQPVRERPAPRQQARSEASQAQRAPRAPQVSPARWQGQVVARIRQFTRRPAGLQGEGTASVSFTINDSGAITSARVARSSGDPEIDAVAVAIVQRASPVPAPPEGIATRRLSVPVRVKR